MIALFCQNARRNIFTIFLCIYFTSFVFAQMPPMRPVNVKIYTKYGEIIKKNSKNYKCSFETGYWYENYSGRAIKEENVNDENGFSVDLHHGDIFKLTIEKKEEKMIVYAQNSLDSIIFQEGEFYYSTYLSYLNNIVPGEGVTISNLNSETFKVEKKHPQYYMKSEYDYEDDNRETPHCRKIADKLEAVHGGKDWAQNVCNDTYADFYITENEKIQDIIDSLENGRTQFSYSKIHPLQKKGFIRHDFYLEKSYDHVISYSTDGINWKPILTLKNEWYVNIIYFPESERIGIDINNSGIVLISDFKLKEWKYYVVNTDEDPPEAKIGAFVFCNANWSDDFYTEFYFSE